MSCCRLSTVKPATALVNKEGGQKENMKRIIVIISALVCLLVAVRLYAQAFDSEGHIVSSLGGSNVTGIASNTVGSAVVGQSITNGSVRWQIVVSNTNASLGLAVKLSGTFPPGTTPDYLIAPNSHPAIFLGEGYNGPISIRSTNATALQFIYNEMYR